MKRGKNNNARQKNAWASLQNLPNADKKKYYYMLEIVRPTTMMMAVVVVALVTSVVLHCMQNENSHRLVHLLAQNQR